MIFISYSIVTVYSYNIALIALQGNSCKQISYQTLSDQTGLGFSLVVGLLLTLVDRFF